jgi:hypothetical protein
MSLEFDQLFERTDYEIELFRDDASNQEAYILSQERYQELFFVDGEDFDIENWWLELRKQPVYDMFEEEYDSYVENEIYFFGCPFKLYKKLHSQRLKEHLKQHEDNSIITFIESEFNEGVFQFNRSSYYMNPKILNNIQASLIKRYEFLANLANENNYDVILNESGKVNLTRRNSIPVFSQEDFIEDLSGSFTIKERIIAMHLLGVLKFLYDKPELKNPNKVASAVRAFTGLKQETVQSYINPVFSNDVDDVKSALYVSEEAIKKGKKTSIEKVEEHLKKHVFE